MFIEGDLLLYLPALSGGKLAEIKLIAEDTECRHVKAGGYGSVPERLRVGRHGNVGRYGGLGVEVVYSALNVKSRDRIGVIRCPYLR